jgi:O-antigen/teichoic acid export membrane protein
VYAAIGVLAASGSSVLSLARLASIVRLRVHHLTPIRHLRSTLYLFGGAVTASVYVYLDSVILGFTCGDRAVGVYSAAMKLARLSIVFLTSLGAVLMPRLSYYLSRGQTHEYGITAQKSIHFIWFIAFPLTAAIFVLAPEVVVTLAGTQFLAASTTLRIAAFIIPIIGFTNFLGQQVFMANGEERKLFHSTLIAAGVGALLNVLLSPVLQYNGTALSVVAAEATVLVAQVRMADRRYLLFRLIDARSTAYLLCSLLMAAALIALKSLTHQPLVTVLVACPLGMAVYLAPLVIIGDPVPRELLHSVRVFLGRRTGTAASAGQPPTSSL